MPTHYNFLAGGEVGRIAALSDGLFAIAATILVLDFHTPQPADIHSETALLGALVSSATRLLLWVLSLLTLGIFWLGQQTQLSQLARSNRDLTWLHFVFLAVVTVLLFSTRLLADFLTYRGNLKSSRSRLTPRTAGRHIVRRPRPRRVATCEDDRIR